MIARFLRLLAVLLTVLPFTLADLPSIFGGGQSHPAKHGHGHGHGHHGHAHHGHAHHGHAHHGHAHHHKHHHKHGKHHFIKGVHSAGVQPRREIRDLYYNFPNQWNMYILALRSFQAEKQSNPLSYYQILGIHGVPYKSWGGVKPTGDSNTGYCKHNSNVFPTWHRPYVALFEEGLHEHAMKIARKFRGPHRKAMEEAARRLRSPYFDWAIKPAKGRPTWPAQLSKKRISVRTQHGPQTIANPLFTYKYHPLEPKWYQAPWNDMHNTKRWPKSGARDAPSQNHLVDRTLRANRPGQKSSLFQFFTNCKTWLEMSNDQVRHSSPGCATSLETMHNNIHVWLGGPEGSQSGGPPGGHMTVIPYSAHDPSFMLHHTQVDRLTAMWQAVYPNKFVPKQKQSVASFATKRGQSMGKDSALKPFRRNARGQFWTSAQARHTTTFGYTYPELMHGGHHANKMRATIKHLYGPNASRHAVGKRSHKVHKRSIEDSEWFNTGEEELYDIGQHEDEDEEEEHPLSVQERQIPGITSPLIASNSSAYQYVANIQTSRYGLGGSYMIYLFTTQPANSDPYTWAYDDNLVGSYGVWSEPGMEDSGIVSSGSVPLTMALTSAVEGKFLSTLSQTSVIPYLKKNLMWKIVGPTGQVMDPSDVPDFQVSVVGSTLAPAASEDEFPTWSNFFELPEITVDKVGGFVGGLIGGVMDGVGNAVGDALGNVLPS